MAESQKHGFDFEKWIRLNKLNEIYNVSFDSVKYTNDWDIPPSSIKSFKYESENPTIEFGSIERVFKNQSSYILILIGYEQISDIKKPVFSDALYIQKEHIDKFKGNLDINILSFLSEEIKKFKIGEHESARKWALEQKKIYNDKTIYDIRFKIDSKSQRRIQCALKLNDIYSVLDKELVKFNKLEIPEIHSLPRERNKEK